jgi:hypothetical protein
VENHFTPPGMFPKVKKENEPSPVEMTTDPDRYDVWQLGVVLYYLGLGKYPYADLSQQVIHDLNRYHTDEIMEIASRMATAQKKNYCFQVVVDTRN